MPIRINYSDNKIFAKVTYTIKKKENKSKKYSINMQACEKPVYNN